MHSASINLLKYTIKFCSLSFVILVANLGVSGKHKDSQKTIVYHTHLLEISNLKIQITKCRHQKFDWDHFNSKRFN